MKPLSPTGPTSPSGPTPYPSDFPPKKDPLDIPRLDEAIKRIKEVYDEWWMDEFDERFGKAHVGDKDGGYFVGSYLIGFIRKIVAVTQVNTEEKWKMKMRSRCLLQGCVYGLPHTKKPKDHCIYCGEARYRLTFLTMPNEDTT